MLDMAYCFDAARAAQARRVGRRLTSRPEIVSCRCSGRGRLRLVPGAGVLEVVADHRGDTFRAVYTVRLADRLYVLHAFQKKSKHGIATPQAEIDLIKRRLKQAIAISEGQE